MKIVRCRTFQVQYTLYNNEGEDIGTIEQLKNMSWIFCPRMLLEFTVSDLEETLKFMKELG